jgi:electron transport complex protein RnfC
MLRKSFKGGVHPSEEKQRTEEKQIINLPLPEKVIIPLQQHIGAPAEIIVQKGDIVKTGQPLAKTNKFVSVPVHASISGTIKAIDLLPHPLGTKLLSIVIENDEKDTWFKPDMVNDNYMNLSIDKIKKDIMEAGIAGMGGAAFPTHAKLSPPSNKPIKTLILNGAECEPYLTADHRLMLEKPEEIIKGLQLIMKILGVKKAIIGIENNKRDAIQVMQNSIPDKTSITVMSFHVKYPQGGEKQLIKAATGLEVPSGGLPMDVGCIVHNVGTVLAVYEAVALKKPLIERIVTVTGPGIIEPNNIRARIGTPFRNLIEYCGGYSDSSSKLINGGPMMGISQITDEVPVIKGTSGILVFDKKSANLQREQPCISCARCVDICPINLLPSKIATFIEYHHLNDAIRMNLMDCIECGSCSFICPSKRNLVQYFKLGKATWNEEQKKAS